MSYKKSLVISSIISAIVIFLIDYFFFSKLIFEPESVLSSIFYGICISAIFTHLPNFNTETIYASSDSAALIFAKIKELGFNVEKTRKPNTLFTKRVRGLSYKLIRIKYQYKVIEIEMPKGKEAEVLKQYKAF